MIKNDLKDNYFERFDTVSYVIIFWTVPVEWIGWQLWVASEFRKYLTLTIK